MSRAQLYLDVSMSDGGRKDLGTYVDLNVAIERLQASRGNECNLVLDPEGSSRWAIQCALRDAFGSDFDQMPTIARLDRLRLLGANMPYLPPMRVHNAVLLDRHDECDHPRGDDY